MEEVVSFSQYMKFSYCLVNVEWICVVHVDSVNYFSWFDLFFHGSFYKARDLAWGVYTRLSANQEPQTTTFKLFIENQIENFFITTRILQ